MLISTSAIRFNWRRLITTEYGSACLWIAALLLVTLKNAWFAGNSQFDGSLVEVLLGSLAVTILGYVVARFLKKSGRLQAARRQEASRSVRVVAGGPANGFSVDRSHGAQRNAKP